MSRIIKWKIHLKSKPETVYDHITTQKGREKFWAESAPEEKNHIVFTFSNGETYKSKILQKDPITHLQIEYFNSIADFYLIKDQSGGTVLEVRNSQVPEEDYLTNYAGWVSLLLTFKAAVDFGVDLRNHNAKRTWSNGFVDN